MDLSQPGISKKDISRSIREDIEAREEATLHPWAVRSCHSAGRSLPEIPCPLRTCFQRDRDRILHSKAFRRLMHKTQVFISPVGDHFRTRLTHTLEVSQVSRTIARALRLNEDLTEAVALGHDLGHPPFGHNGEDILNELLGQKNGGFRHELHSVRITEHLEPMNLTVEVLEGMASQASTKKALTLEAQVVKIADRITYLHHDAEDAARAGLMSEKDLPADLRRTLGDTRQARLDRMVIDLVRETEAALESDAPAIVMSREIGEAMGALRKWMFRNVYLIPSQLAQKQKVRRVIRGLFDFYLMNPEAISPNIPEIPEDGKNLRRRAADYIAGMTDRYAIERYNRHLLPTPYEPAHDLQEDPFHV